MSFLLLIPKNPNLLGKTVFSQDGIMGVFHTHSNNIFISKYTTNTVSFSMAIEKAAGKPCISGTLSAVLYNLLLLSLPLTFFPIAGQICHLIHTIRPITARLFAGLYLESCNQHLFTN